MSSNLNDIEYNFHLDKEQMQHDYPASDIQWIYLNDINNGSYSNNYINFSNINLLGSDTSKFLDFSQAYVQIPITVQATCSAVSNNASVNCYWGNASTVATGNPTVMVDAKENAYAVGMKPFHHIIDYASLKIGGVPVNRNSQWNNFYINEQLKKMNKDEYDLMGEILNYSLDSAESLNTSTTASYIIESNNNTVCPNSANALSLGPSTKSFQNQGHLSRMLRLNNDLINSNLKAAGVSSATLQNSYQNAYLGANGTAAANNLYSTIYWTYNCIVPLSKIHDFYAKMPSINSTQGFELRLQTNVGSPNQNYWTHSFAIAAGALDVTSSASQFGAVGTAGATATLSSLTCSSSQSFGHTCPFILSIPNVSGNNVTAAGNFIGTGCAVFPATSAANATTVSIRVSSLIGYQNNGSSTATIQPCRLWVPMITFNPSYTNSIMRNPVYKMLYRDFYVDTIEKVDAGKSVSRLYSIQISRPRTMYIIPFLSTINTTAANAATTYPYQMLTSSAPTTCSPCRLRNFNLQIGGSNIFVNPLQYNTDFYDNNQLHLLAKEIANGNSYKSQLFSGLITKRMWELAYGVYAFNLEKVDSIESDNLTKNFQISFTVESASGAIAYSYDFICIIDYECEMYLDRITGTITSK